MKQYNSLYNVILDAVVAIAFITTMIINACSISKVNDTLHRVYTNRCDIIRLGIVLGCGK